MKQKIKIIVDDPGLVKYYGIKKGMVCTVQSVKHYKKYSVYQIMAPRLYGNNYGDIGLIAIKSTECIITGTAG